VDFKWGYQMGSNGNFVRGFCEGVTAWVCVCCFQKEFIKGDFTQGFLNGNYKWEFCKGLLFGDYK